MLSGKPWILNISTLFSTQSIGAFMYVLLHQYIKYKIWELKTALLEIAGYISADSNSFICIWDI